MKFLVEWLDGGENAAVEERATLCDLRIFVGDDNACMFFDDAAREVFDCLTVPAVHLAEGIARDWWRIFGGRDRRQSLVPYRTGFVLPDLGFRCDGSTFEIEGRQLHCANPGLRFWQVDGERCSRSAAEQELAAFVGCVVDKLTCDGIRDCEATLGWQRVCASREDPAEAAFCEAAGALDLDPYSMADEDADFIERAGSLFSDEALIEFLASGSPQGAGKFRSPASTMNWLDSLKNRQSYESRLPKLAELRDQFGDAALRRANEPPWAQGYRVANLLAAELNISGRDLATPEALTKRMGSRRFQRVHARNIEPGIRAVVDPDAGVHLRDRGRGKFPWAAQAETFALTRAIGSVLCLPHTERLVVNNLHHAEQQAVGRAFAAQFLAPVDKIREMAEDGLEEREIAHEFKVSPQVVTLQLENQERNHRRAAA